MYRGRIVIAQYWIPPTNIAEAIGVNGLSNPHPPQLLADLSKAFQKPDAGRGEPCDSIQKISPYVLLLKLDTV